MTGILRTWRCLNRDCGEAFDSWESNPRCPVCRCVRVDWMPAGGHIGGTSRSADRELRALADVFRMTDMNSAEQGQGAKRVKTAPPTPMTPTTAHNFGGFIAAVNPDAALAATGNPAQCVPIQNKVKAKVKTARERALPTSYVTAGHKQAPIIEYSHKGKLS